MATKPHLVNVSTQRLAFEWSGTLQCSSVHYEINATGCGMCPTYTFTNGITCKGVYVKSLSVCTISVKVVSCGRYSLSEYMKDVILKG